MHLNPPLTPTLLLQHTTDRRQSQALLVCGGIGGHIVERHVSHVEGGRGATGLDRLHTQVRVGVRVGVRFGVRVGVRFGVRLAVGVGFGIGLRVKLGLGFEVEVEVGVGVGVGFGAAISASHCPTTLDHHVPSSALPSI